MNSLQRIAAAAVAACSLLVTPALADGPQVTAPAGALEGTNDGTIRVFKGIPYAVPPLGNGRWRPPVALPAWQGVRPAKDFGPACMQPIWHSKSVYSQDIEPISEDCLTLNVWAPAEAKNAP